MSVVSSRVIPVEIDREWITMSASRLTSILTVGRNRRLALPLAVALAAFAATSCSQSTQPQSNTGPNAQPAPTMPRAEAQRIEIGVLQPSQIGAGSVLASDVLLAADALTLLPDSSTITLDENRFSATGDLASVPATVSGPDPGQWLLLLVREDDNWQIYGTRPA